MLSTPLSAQLVLMASVMLALAGMGRSQSVTPVESQELIKALQTKVSELQAANEAMASSVASAKIEKEASEAETSILKNKLEAAGIGLVAGSNGIEQRLIAAISDLRLEKDRSKSLSAQLLKLAETSLLASRSVFPQISSQTQPFQTLEKEVDLTQLLLSSPGKSAAGQKSFENQVVSVSRERNLVVFNGGEASGLITGTPVKIVRGDRPVASALVVDVRKNVTGALVSSTYAPDDYPRPGDTLRVDAVKN